MKKLKRQLKMMCVVVFCVGTIKGEGNTQKHSNKLECDRNQTTMANLPSIYTQKSFDCITFLSLAFL